MEGVRPVSRHLSKSLTPQNLFTSKLITRGLGVSRAVMMEHTLFSLPLAASAILLESSGRPALSKVLWIIVAVFGARNAANALNRIIDLEIDRANPRTADRDLPSGRVSSKSLWAFTFICGAMLLLAAFMLNPLCLALVPVAAVLIGGYSFTKRFTWLCHYWLGLTCSAATMGSFLALTGSFSLRFFPLTAGAALWVAGFDIIYALQDIDHDREAGLHSIPARFGKKGGLLLAGLTHAGTVFFFAVNIFFFHLGIWYMTGVAVVALILLAEHLIAWNGSIKWIPFASYRLNQIFSPAFLLFVILDIYLRGGMYGN